ncbi:c-type cytochrome [Undibacterium sp. RuRC25W]|uniref:c-type cytochrome n=1 Tax=Undibacterium sp. RuRC25W TaxID=3413047 RepID=UPI003BF0D622
MQKIFFTSGLLLLSITLTSTFAFAQTDDEQGKKLFTEKAVPACAFCHSLKHADSMAESGPDMDSLQPDAKTIENAIRYGKGEMPAIKGLSEEEIKVLVRYLQRVAGKS